MEKKSLWKKVVALVAISSSSTANIDVLFLVTLENLVRMILHVKLRLDYIANVGSDMFKHFASLFPIVSLSNATRSAGNIRER